MQSRTSTNIPYEMVGSPNNSCRTCKTAEPPQAVNDECEQAGKKTGSIYFKPDGLEGKPYVRILYKEAGETDISEKCKPEKDVHRLLFKDGGWNLERPNLIISVTGGAKDLTMSLQEIKDVKRRLLNIASQAGAWLITGGTNIGIMKIIGEAVREYNLTNKTRRQLVVLGITQWGAIRNTSKFCPNCGDCHDYLDAVTCTQEPGKKYYLNQHHSHFVLVDDNQNTFGSEIDFRANLEDLIAKSDEGSISRVPIVTMVFGGGENTLKTVKRSLDKNIPVLCVEGSGRAADFIIETVKDRYQYGVDKQTKTKQSEGFEKLTDLIVDLKNNRDKIFVFKSPHGGEREQNENLDKTILTSLIKTNQMKDLREKLYLAVAWGCHEYAVTDLFQDDEFPNRVRKGMFMYEFEMALMENRPEFVESFLDVPFDLSKFLQNTSLQMLYGKVKDRNELPAIFLLRDVLAAAKTNPGSDVSVLIKLGKVLSDLMQRSEWNIYAVDVTKLKDPYWHLLLWSIFTDRHELTFVFWKYGKNQIGVALAASHIFKALHKEANKQGEVELSQDLVTLASQFESAAVGVLSKCHRFDKRISQHILIRQLEQFGGQTLLSMADNFESMEFMEQSSCQTKLNRTWSGSIAHCNPQWKVLMCMLFPFLVVAIDFVSCSTLERKGVSKHQDRQKCRGKMYRVRMPCCRTSDKTIDITLLQAWKQFYTAPSTKFYFHTLSRSVYLALFSVMLLSEFRPSAPGAMEVMLWVWTATMALEEVHEMIRGNFKSNRQIYILNKWNLFDITILLLFLASVILRLALSVEDFGWARHSYAITLMLFYMRFLDVFFVSKIIGPKLVMIRGMITDMVFFLLIMVTVILAYGVAKQAVLYPNREPNFALIGYVVAHPFWNVFGDLFLDELQGDVGDCTDNITIAETQHVARCPHTSTVILILHGIYMLLTNVLLLNLLIAMFSYTFSAVQENSERVWRFYRYSLILDYCDKPVLPPPFIIFSHAWLLIGSIRHLNANNDEKDHFSLKCSEEEHEDLTTLEHIGTSHYLDETRTTKDRVQL